MKFFNSATVQNLVKHSTIGQQRPTRLPKGFTLVELIVVVAIVGILLVIALADSKSYFDRKARFSILGTLKMGVYGMKEFYKENGTYKGACNAQRIRNDNAVFRCESLSPTTFTIQAEGIGILKGFTYSINQDGLEQTLAMPNAWGAVPTDCWLIRKNRCYYK